jgi:hypothetical protein
LKSLQQIQKHHLQKHQAEEHQDKHQVVVELYQVAQVEEHLHKVKY